MRKSNFELLRIFSIWGIIIIHIWGFNCSPDLNHFNFISKGFLAVLGNTGVSCFILISGYFSIRFNTYKLWMLWMKSWFLAVIASIGYCIIFKEPFFSNHILHDLLPISTGKYWFITDYICLYLLSPFLNKFKNLPPQHRYYLLAILLFFFYISPTLFSYSIITVDGKNIGNMITLYLIGMQISLTKQSFYSSKMLSNKMLIILLSICIITGLVFYCFVSIEVINDSSLLILIESIIIFKCFERMKISSNFINKLASASLAIYILHLHLIMDIFDTYVFKFRSIDNEYLLVPCVLLDCLFIFFTSYLINYILNPFITYTGKKIYSFFPLFIVKKHDLR